MRALIFVLAATAVLGAQTINFSGKWVIGTAGRGGAGGSGGRGWQTLTLNHVGREVTGELVGGGGGGGGSTAPINNEIYAGKVEGNTVSFYVWRGTDKPYRVTYTGTINAAGDEISFIVTGAPGRGGAPGAGGPAGAAGSSPTPAPTTIARRAQ